MRAVVAAALVGLLFAPPAAADTVAVPLPQGSYVVVDVTPGLVDCTGSSPTCVPPCTSETCPVEECVGPDDEVCVHADEFRFHPEFEEAGFETYRESNGLPGLQRSATYKNGTWIPADRQTFSWYPVRL